MEWYVDIFLRCSYNSIPIHQVNLEALFNEVNVAKATEMFLSLLREKDSITSPQLAARVPPMEIKAYKLSWHQ